MGFFNNKSKMTIEDFCNQYYENKVFSEVKRVFLDKALKSLIDVDKSFEQLTRKSFGNEMLALQIELFGLAWQHVIKKEEKLFKQCTFSNEYLERNNGAELIESITEYNKAIAKSTTLDNTGARIDKSKALSMNQRRTDFFNKWRQKSMESICIGRVANRLGAEMKTNGLTHKLLVSRLAMRLGLEPPLTKEALFKLLALVFGMYKDAYDAIKLVKLTDK